MSFQNLFNFWHKKQNSTDSETDTTYINFVCNPNGYVDITTCCKQGDEERYADMLFLINSPNMPQMIIELLKRKNQKDVNINEVQKYFDKLHDEVDSMVKEMSKGPIVRPSQVFK